MNLLVSLLPVLFQLFFGPGGGSCSNISSEAQTSNEQDCFNARLLNITSCFPKLIIDSVTGFGLVPDEADNSCLDFNNADPNNPNSEKKSKWFKWTANDNLKLSFTISRLKSNDDIDFVLFELPDGINGCNTKRIIRCSATACNLTSMGLDEKSIDIEESPNCDPGEDGFLRALDQIKGRTYGLLINNFTSTGGFSLEFNPKQYSLKPDKQVVKYQIPTLFDVLDNDTIIGRGSIRVIIDNPQNGSFNYSQSTGKGTYTPKEKFSGKEKLNYIVCSTECPGLCTSSTIEFEIEPPCADRNSIVLPNIIFPNGTKNRYFIVEPLIRCLHVYGPRPTKLMVYNRWGGLVFHTNDYQNNWDGITTNGDPLPEGTYYYLLDLGSVSAPLKGYVVIVR